MKRWSMVLAAICLSASVSLTAQGLDDADGADLFAEPAEAKNEPVFVNKAPAKKMVKLPPDCDSFGFELALSNPSAVKVQIETAGDKYKKSFTVSPGEQILMYEADAKKGEMALPPETFKNHVMNMKFPDFKIDYYAFPNFTRYKSDAVNKNMVKWDAEIPNALKRKLRVDLRPAKTGIAVYLDGTYAGIMKGSSRLKSVNITGGEGPEITHMKPYVNEQSTPDYEAVDFPRIANPGVMKSATLSIKPGFTKINGIPMYVADGAHSSDLSLVKGLKGMNFTAEIDYYMERTAWERLPECQQGSVPNGYYTEAYVLFALDPDPKKDRSFSFRFGRFSRWGRVNGWAYTDVFLPKKDSDFPANVKKVGTVQLNGKELPLYFGTFPIDIGVTADIITHDVQTERRCDYLDYEFMGRRSLPGAYGDPSHRPDEKKPSAVNLFGVTFKKAGIFLDFVQKEPGNIFYNDEVPETTVVVKSEKPGDYTITWRIMDSFSRKELKTGSETMSFTKAGEEKRLTVPLSQPDVGHYFLDFDVIIDGKKAFTHHAAFALLGKDTRLAEPTESPFGSWWTGAHLGIRDPEVVMRIFHKAGIRRPCGLHVLMDSKGNLSPENQARMKKYKMILNQFGWPSPPAKDADPKAYDTFMHANYDPLVKAFPDTKYALIFHESFGDPQVPESYGEKAEATDKDKKYAKTAADAAEWLRAHYPDIKLCYGNNTSSSALTAALLRSGYNKDLIDFIGSETPGQGCIPERIWQGGTQGIWFSQEVGRTWGVDLKVTGCFEYSARPDRMFVRPHDQAAYYMRDALIGLGYGFETLGISGLNDAGNWYTQTIWGSGSLCKKAPFLYPKPMLAAYAAMTRALDRIKFNPVSRDTGNLSCYALEFERKCGDAAYALWVPKGESEVVFEFPENVDGELIGFLGKTSRISGKTIRLTASIYPQYLVVPKKADAVKHVKTISPEPGKNYTPAIKFENMADITVVEKDDT